MKFLNSCFALLVTLSLANAQFSNLNDSEIANLNRSELIFSRRGDDAPRALLVNQWYYDPVESIARDQFTMCLYARLEKYRDLKSVDLLSFSSRNNSEVNEIVVEINYEDEKTNLYIHGELESFKAIPPLQEWFHLCLSWESKTGKSILYINGERAGKTATLQKGYEIGGGGYFVLGQDQDSFNGGFDAETGIHGRLTDFNIWNRTLSIYEVKQSQQCNLEGDVVSWDRSFWRLFGPIFKENSTYACPAHYYNESKPLNGSGCSCDYSKFVEFQNMFFQFSTQVQTELSDLKLQLCNLTATNVTASHSNDTLQLRITDNENEITVLKEFREAYGRELVDLRRKMDVCEKGMNILEQKSRQRDVEILQQMARSTDCSQKIANLEKSCSLSINALQAQVERNRNEMLRSNICPNKFVNIGGICYYFSTFAVADQSIALKNCKSMDARASLLGLETSDEWTNIRNYFLDHKRDLKARSWVTSGVYGKLNGLWMWTGSNQSLQFTGWCPQEPNNHLKNEFCLDIYSHNETVCWNDLPCSSWNFHFICEVKNA